MVNREIIHLFRKFVNNCCDSKESEQVFLYIENGEFLEEWNLAIQEEADDAIANDQDALEIMSDYQKGALQKRIQKRINKGKIRSIWVKYSAAALVLIALTISLILYNSEESDLESQKEVALITDVTPGGDAATLTLSDGTIIALESEDPGNLAVQENVTIVKKRDGELIYQPIGNNKRTVTFNTLTTPRGGQYQVVLPDGTKAWLNAASSIIYPTAFVGDKRSVKVKGEVYFEVMPNKDQPFIVETSGQTIEVLGTHFNVNAYDDEGVIRTTLLEGSVKVTLPSKRSSILNPGQQSVVTKGKDRISLDQVDVEAVMGWKNGDIYFDNTDLSGVMRQLARWYNVDVDFTGMPDKKLNGIISRNVNLSVVLEAIEQTSNIRLKIESTSEGAGRRVSME